MAANDRDSFIDLWRLIAILVIMGHHQYHVGARDYPFVMGWVFVEFFFILTGYLTTAHFARSRALSLEDKAKNAVSYTVKKFLRFIPFVWAAVILEYALQIAVGYQAMLADLPAAVSRLAKMPLELLLVGSSYTKPELVPLWYLSAMFIVFPLFCLLLQAANKYLLAIISFTVPLIYYGAVGVGDNWTFPLNLARAFSAMLLGALVYTANDLFLHDLYAKLGKLPLTAIQLACVAFPVLACYFSVQSVLRLVVLCFAVGLSITLSGRSATAGVKSRVMEYLGTISMQIYLFHWVVAGVVAACFGALPQPARIAIYYIGSILVAAASYELYRRIKKRLPARAGAAS